MGGCLRGLWKDLYSCEAREWRCQEDEERCVGGSSKHASLAPNVFNIGGGVPHDERWKVASYGEGRRLIDECRREIRSTFHTTIVYTMPAPDLLLNFSVNFDNTSQASSAMFEKLLLHRLFYSALILLSNAACSPVAQDACIYRPGDVAVKSVLVVKHTIHIMTGVPHNTTFQVNPDLTVIVNNAPTSLDVLTTYLSRSTTIETMNRFVILFRRSPNRVLIDAVEIPTVHLDLVHVALH